MSKRKFNFVLVVFVLALFALTVGGCGGSSHHSSTSQMERFADTFGEIVDRMQEIASIASSDSAIMAAVQDIIPLYNSSNDQGVIYNIFKSLTQQDIVLISGLETPFNARAKFDITKWHFKYENGKLADGYPTKDNSDFQIEVTSGDHTTTLTLTNSGSTSYWKANAQMSYILSEVAQKAGYISPDVTVLLFNKVYSDINIKLDYKASSSASSVNLLTGTLRFSSDKTDVYAQTPRTTSYNLTITIPGLDNEKLNITGMRVVTNPSTSSMRTDADLSVSKNGEDFFSFNAGMDVSASSSGSASIKLNELNTKLTDKLVLDLGATSSNQIDVSKLLNLYNTGTDASKTEVESNADAINALTSTKVYVKNKLNSYIKAFAGTLGNYYHIRLGHQFVDDSLGVIYKLKEIVDEDDWSTLQQIIKKLLPQINVITGLMQNIVSDSGDSVIGVNLSQEIIQLLMQHFFAED